MKRTTAGLQLSASDLVGFLNCLLTAFDRAVANGRLAKPKVWDQNLEILRQRGLQHEQSYIDHLKAAGLDVVEIGGIGVSTDSVLQTMSAMKRGAAVIVQAALSSDGWAGRAPAPRPCRPTDPRAHLKSHL